MTIKKVFELGLGVANFSLDVAKKGLTELEKKGHITKKDQEKLLKEFATKSKKHKDALLKLIKDESNKAHDKIIKKAGYVKKSEYTKLEKRIALLEKKIKKTKKK